MLLATASKGFSEIDGKPPVHLRPGDSIVLARGDRAIFEVHEPSITLWAIFGEEPLGL